MSRVPTIAALQAFESAARHGSFTRAALELHRTQGAISQQIRQLEQQLNTALFERVQKRVVLTAAGTRYLADVQKILRTLSEATNRVVASGGRNMLSIAVVPSFSSRWLIPRLPDFFAGHADVVIDFVSRGDRFDFKDCDVDAAIHYGKPAWAGASVEFLMDDDKVAVCSPAFRRRHDIRGPEKLDETPLLQLRTQSSAWPNWFARAGVPAHDVAKGVSFDSFNMIAEAAKAGLGAGLVPRVLVERELESGELVLVADTSVPGDSAYYFVSPEHSINQPLVKQFRRWIQEQVEATAPRLALAKARTGS